MSEPVDSDITAEDIATFVRSTTYNETDTEYGSVIVEQSDAAPKSRWKSYDWLTEENELQRDGKAILVEWAYADDPIKSLQRHGAQTFIQQGRTRQLQTNHADDSRSDSAVPTYKGLRVRQNCPEELSVPSGHDQYYERTLAGGKTELEVMGHALKHGNHLDLKGETGTGKSEAVLHLAQQANVGVEQVNFSEEVRMSYLLGHYEVYSQNGATEMQWVDGVLTKCLRYGGWFLADEHDMVSGDVSSLLHSATEKGDAVVTIPEKGETIDVHEEFRFIGTRNINYAGSNQVNKAYESRLQSLTFEYLPYKQEVKVVMSATQFPRDRITEVKTVVQIGRELREAYLDGSLPKPITLRSMIRAAEFMQESFMTPMEAAKTAYLHRFPKHSGHRSSVETKIETFGGV